MHTAACRRRSQRTRSPTSCRVLTAVRQRATSDANGCLSDSTMTCSMVQKFLFLLEFFFSCCFFAAQTSGKNILSACKGPFPKGGNFPPLSDKHFIRCPICNDKVTPHPTKKPRMHSKTSLSVTESCFMPTSAIIVAACLPLTYLGPDFSSDSSSMNLPPGCPTL